MTSGVRRSRLFCGVAVLGLILATAAQAAPRAQYRIPPQALDSALRDFGAQSGATILVDTDLTGGKSTRGFIAAADPETALRTLLSGTGLSYRRDGDVFAVTRISTAPRLVAEAPQPSPAASQTGSSVVEELVVTAQKKEEKIQSVPIAISAFNAQALDELKIEGGPDLLKAVPNMTFSKNNFSGYNLQIRGVGTKAVSVTTDPAVAVSFNNTPLIRNRLFEQEYFDVERVETLRGPQGTLYGRNATGGVVNVISAKPTNTFEGLLKGEVGNYGARRLTATVNLPLTDTLAVRLAGASTERDGFDHNTTTGNDVNGRDLWSTRLSVKWEPVDRFRANFVWEHFYEHDNRSRTGKQLCNRDPGPTSLAGYGAITDPVVQGILSQGCLPTTLFSDSAYGTPNGNSLPLVIAGQGGVQLGFDPNTFAIVSLLKPGVDPYGAAMQSRDLHEIASNYDPKYKARNDVYQLNLDFDLTPDLVLSSQSLYSQDRYYASQDYNRFNTQPVFNDSRGLIDPMTFTPITEGLTPGGIYTDPQLGASASIIGIDINQARSKQWSQELRLQSNYAGPINFSLGANYLRYKTDEDYTVMFNIASAIAEGLFNGALPRGSCLPGDTSGCVYLDPNPLGSTNGDGHNYFRSRNPYKVESSALFGELYWQVAPEVRVTAGLRYTDDKKTFQVYPTQLLLAPGSPGYGYINSGYRELDPIRQEWREVTGRLGVDWKPQLSFTDETMLYAFYSRGYKGGGANPPGVDFNPDFVTTPPTSSTFKPEFVNAFELGAKNTLLGGSLVLNGSAFYYDYNNYQVSKIIDRTAANENFDARIWGLELESVWRPTPQFRMNANIGYLNTRIADGSKSIDVMNRTQGDPNYTLVKPWLQQTSNCIAPTTVVAQVLATGFGPALLTALCGGGPLGNFKDPTSLPSLLTGIVYDPATAPGGGAGIAADIGGNEMPNSPHFTFNLGAQYTVRLPGAWTATLRGDYYRQGKSFARVYNTDYDRLKAWDNGNLSLIIEDSSRDLTFQVYAKNIFNDTPITDAFTNSDDTGLTTNVFTLDPRLIGVSVAKRF